MFGLWAPNLSESGVVQKEDDNNSILSLGHWPIAWMGKDCVELSLDNLITQATLSRYFEAFLQALDKDYKSHNIARGMDGTATPKHNLCVLMGTPSCHISKLCPRSTTSAYESPCVLSTENTQQPWQPCEKH